MGRNKSYIYCTSLGTESGANITTGDTYKDIGETAEMKIIEERNSTTIDRQLQ